MLVYFSAEIYTAHSIYPQQEMLWHVMVICLCGSKLLNERILFLRFQS